MTIGSSVSGTKALRGSFPPHVAQPPPAVLAPQGGVAFSPNRSGFHVHLQIRLGDQYPRSLSRELPA